MLPVLKSKIVTSGAIETLSNKWRTQRSELRHVDMAHTLKAIQKVVGYVLPTNIDVRFATKEHTNSYNNGHHIVIDPQYAMKGSPSEPQHEDILIGLAMHEAGHSIVSTGDINPVDVYMPSGETVHVDKLGEEVYVDRYMGSHWLNAKDYIVRARDAYNLPLEDYENLHDIFLYICVYGNIVDAQALGNSSLVKVIPPIMNMAAKLKEKDLTILSRQLLYEDTAKKIRDILTPNQNSDQGKSSAPKFPSTKRGKSSAGRKAKERAEQSKATNNVVESPPDQRELDTQGFPNTPPTLKDQEQSNKSDNSGEGQLSSEGDKPGNEGPNTESSTSYENDFHSKKFVLSDKITNEIKASIEQEEEDLVREIRTELQFEGSLDTRSILYRKSKTEPMTMFNQTLAKQLAWLRELKNTVGAQFYRNEVHGRVDQRNLYKAPINGKVFKRKVKLPRKEQDIVLLLDASYSMSRILSVYEDAHAVFRALDNAVVLSYNDYNDTVYVERHDEGKVMRVIHPAGTTPSGPALLSAALKFPESLIIHFTDGQPNQGETAQKALATIEKNCPSIKVVNIIYASSADNYPESASSKTIVLEDIRELPTLLKHALTMWGYG